MSRLAPRLVLALIALAALIFGALQFQKLHSFGYNGLDLAIYTNTVYHLAHGQGFALSIHDPTYLGDHLELGLIPIAAVYRFAPTALTLLWIQTIIITGTAWLVWIFLRRLLGWQAGLVGAALWLLHPIVYNVALYEFHGLVFAWPLIWWSIIAYHSQRRWQWWISLGLLCLVREDMPLIVLGWGLLAAIDRRGWRWWGPAFLAGAAWFVIAQRIIAAHNPDDAYKYLVFYNWAGSTPWEIITVPFRHPIIFLSHIFQPNNWQTALGFLVAGGGIVIFRLRRLIPLLIPAAQLLMLSVQPAGILHIHYTIPYLPFLIWGSAEAWQAIRSRQLWARYDHQMAVAFATILLIVGPLYAHLLYGPLETPWKTMTDRGQSQRAILAAAAAEVRPNDRVITTFNFLPTLANRDRLYSLNYLYLGRRQYSEKPYRLPTDIDVAIIDWQQMYQYQFIYRDTLFQGRTGAERIRDLLTDKQLDLVWWKDGVAVYRRGGRDTYVPTSRIPVTAATGQPVGPITLRTSPTIHALAEDRVGDERYSIIPVSFEWYTAEKISTPLSIRFSLVQNKKTVWTSTRLLGDGVYPSVDWPVGSGWVTRYLLNIPKAITGEATLKADIVAFDGVYRLNRLRTFMPVINEEKVHAQLTAGAVTLPNGN